MIVAGKNTARCLYAVLLPAPLLSCARVRKGILSNELYCASDFQKAIGVKL